jgi:lysophospholipase L1-like esterase/pimeloyl-ACP methyl ester carboxylesterase
MIRLLVSLFVFLNSVQCLFAQNEPAWDNARNKYWGKEFSHIQIISSADGKLHNAWFYKTSKKTAQPLIISLHTWSGDYSQEDPLAKEILLRDWNYIHPDFRGSNNNANACGSALVIADLEDAIVYAAKNGNVDTTNVHIVGVSGGGYATLLAYMKLNYTVKSFNAWVPISNLTDWYWESKGRNAKYAGDIEKVAMKNGIMNWKELESRPPVHLIFPADKRKNTILNIYAGIHDGYTGSVPISHSISFYNKIAAELFPGEEDRLVTDSMLLSLLVKRINLFADTSFKLNGRKIFLQKQLPNLNLTIFDGEHEMLVSSALVLAPVDKNINQEKLTVFTIGDSNGAFDYGWPQQMMKLMPYATIFNKSISGNTIGFDNLGQPQLNTLANISQYLDEAFSKLGANEQLDYILIGLGTNDVKTIFIDRQKEVKSNMAALLQRINSYLKAHNKKTPRICIITPSPVDEHKIDTLKYGGGDLRIQHNNKLFQNIAINNNTDFLDSYSLLKINFSEKTADGIHLNEKTQFELASIILTYINKKSKQ